MEFSPFIDQICFLIELQVLSGSARRQAVGLESRVTPKTTIFRRAGSRLPTSDPAMSVCAPIRVRRELRQSAA